MRRLLLLLLIVQAVPVWAQEPAYVLSIPAEPPYYRVRYEAATEAGGLAFPVSYTVWIPSGVPRLRGVIVHQHGCGEGSCKSGQTGAFDLHWQALARKHHCALLSPVYEQPEKANCHLWCDPRNGSDQAFQKALVDLGMLAKHPELATVPWALWGHSGGGFWAGGMTLLHPDRVAAAWLRSGVPPVVTVEGRPGPYEMPPAACQVPIMCNLGTQEGFTVTDGRFSGVWAGVKTFFTTLRGKSALVGVSIDPLSSHDCGNQRYYAIAWLDACLTARLPEQSRAALRSMSEEVSYIAPLPEAGKELIQPIPVTAEFTGDRTKTMWLPNQAMAAAWTQYSHDTALTDSTPPPAPTDIQVQSNIVSWQAEADLESGIGHFVIERDGQVIGQVPPQPKNPFGRPLFQGLSYSDTPAQPLAEMRYTDSTAEAGRDYTYRVISVNTVGLQSK